MGLHEPKDMSVHNTIRIFYTTAKKHKADFYLAALQPIGGLLMGLAVPYFAGKVLASLVHPTPQQNTYLVLLGCATAAAIVANRFGFRRLMHMQAKTMADLNMIIFERLLNRSVGFHVNRISGKLVSDALDFITAFATLVSAAVINGMTFLGVIFIGLFIVFINSWQLGLYLLAVVIIILSWTLIETGRRAVLRHKRLIATKNLTSHLSDTIVNAQTTKTFAREATEISENKRLNKILLNLRLRDWTRAGTSGNNRMGTLLTLQFGMIVLITQLVQSHPEMLATAIFALTYTLTFSSRLLELNAISMQIDDAFLNAGPMTKMLLEDAEIKDVPNARELNVPKGAITIKDAYFAYAETEQDTVVFEKLALDIQPGEKIGLVGPSGGGKSTLTRLLLRFDDLNDGAILIDGQNIAEVTQTSLRHNIAYVPQEPLLFHRTVRENIAYGKPNATDAEITAAARQAQADDFILNLPQGYDTVVGERGVKLSGGQRQRIAIARAILKDAPILILDDATSALDSESEVAIQKALWELMKGRTAIVVAHRLSTIQKMDRIIVLNDGKILEQGNHKKLIQLDGLYAQLWNHQSGGFIED
jgi:ATP-binding cassette subfamily B protein